MSHLSTVTKGEGEATYTWKCEFCGAVNADLALSPEELPAGLTAG